MKAFSPLSTEMQAAMAPHHRLIQGAIATIAHENMGLPVDDLRGVERYEGGVYVNGREIVIKDSMVVGSDDAGQEEIAVVDAIYMLREAWKSEGPDILRKFTPVRIGEPLRRLLRVDSLVVKTAAETAG